MRKSLVVKELNVMDHNLSVLGKYQKSISCYQQYIWIPKTSSVTHRSNHHRCSINKGALKNCSNFTGKYLCRSLFFSKAAYLKPTTLSKPTPTKGLSSEFNS